LPFSFQRKRKKSKRIKNKKKEINPSKEGESNLNEAKIT